MPTLATPMNGAMSVRPGPRQREGRRDPDDDLVPAAPAAHGAAIGAPAGQHTARRPRHDRTAAELSYIVTFGSERIATEE
ncbi:hypothetical protein RB614_36410 [Phytohabitans sp. ZYX-F-186]|uniref:Uncharacterized protein n=1 Tax=Phytohabitans maris TaxID=3071409 RepID=A0ABU0ZT74_9ACTN|nr:hypothetical protein [Phytohabitans sp. ZYX-F-186]MDQ7909996.1 hypothetical protein [Phytohabitans sp. ZYX-F-186]